MTLDEVLSNEVSVRKTLWSKRGKNITHKVINKKADFDIQPRKYIHVKDEGNESRS